MPVDVVWEIGADREDYKAGYVGRRDAFADAARDAAWNTVLDLLAGEPSWINAPRIGSATCFAPLHQAAWHGADQDVVRRLLDAGAWRSLRTADGARAVDIAASRGHPELVEVLTPVPPADRGAVADMEVYLHALIMVRTRPLGDRRTFRLPQVEPLPELPRGGHMWCPVPGMYGGFDLRWDGGAVECESWSRVVDGSERRHRITPEGIELVQAGQ